MKEVQTKLPAPTVTLGNGGVAEPSMGPSVGGIASINNNCATLERLLAYYGKRFKDLTTKYLDEFETIEWGLEHLIEPYMEDLPSLEDLEVMRDTLRNINRLRDELNLYKLSEEVTAIKETLEEIGDLLRLMYLPDLQELETIEARLAKIGILMEKRGFSDLDDLENIQETLETIYDLLYEILPG
jgi:hypothetical protein